MATYKTPDVYIEEFEPAAPIAGVGTSTAAFLGACLSGPLNEPTAIKSWDQFRRLFGNAPVPGMRLWYAVRGFYENGGTECYVTRVSNASYGQMVLDDLNGQPTIVARARQAGPLTPGLQVTVDANVHTVDPATAHLFRPTANIVNAAINSTQILLSSANDAERFRPGDRLTWSNVAAPDDGAVVARVNGATLEVLAPLSQAYGAEALRLADPASGTDVLRLEGAPNVAPGMVVTLEQTAPAAVNETLVVKSVQVEALGGGTTTYRVTFRTGLVLGFDFSGGAVTASSAEFSLTITPVAPPAPPPPPRVYAGLGMDPAHPRYFARIVNAADPDVSVMAVDPPNVTVPPANRPATLAASSIANGSPDSPATLTPADYNGAIDALQAIDDVNILVVPDRQDAAVQGHLVGHCELMQDRFAVLDTAQGLPPYGAASAQSHRTGLISARGYGALYYPWLLVMDDKGVDTLLVPPSGHVAGIYARTDQSRGVHKAPAGLECNVRGALAAERLVSAIEQGDLNLGGVNVLRVFGNGAPPTVWGARTLASDANWQYVNIRRLFLYLEESIQEGLKGAVFEPNNPQLWQQLKRTLTDFLTRSWRDGALFGRKAAEAFYVRIDDELNPFSEQQLGRLHIEVGVRPSYPAEFIIVRIGIWDGGSSVSES
jgi:phage tail sheath protein FI